MADLPFLKNKNKKRDGVVVAAGTSEDSSKDLLPHIADELLQAIDKKDLKAIRAAVKALVLMIRDERNGQ